MPEKELQRAKRCLRIKKEKAAKTKHIPLAHEFSEELNNILTPYDLYFVSQIEPALNDIFWAAMKGKMSSLLSNVIMMDHRHSEDEEDLTLAERLSVKE